ncbi:MAG TPA: hypothetical protein VMP00_15220 [Burkholderiales bacterium]|nr:hypothetical protein [Burkholderiales bacterium]
MFKSTKFALALSGALFVSGCATTAWQPPAHHPADPGAEAGGVTAITALERYRSGTATVTVPEDAGEQADPGHDHHHHDRGEADQ